MSEYHVSVLLHEALESLQIVPGNTYIDATLGAGGHCLAIAEMGGFVLGIDQDSDAIRFVEQTLLSKSQDVRKRIKLVKGNFRDIAKIAKTQGLEKVHGVLFDLGVSSHQLDTKERGFSFLGNGPLDMRMDNSISVTAADLVNGLHKGELIDLFTKYGEEPFAKKIAQAIVDARLKKRIETTAQLADMVVKAVPRSDLPAGRQGKMHPATRVFQALRIAVNDELHSLEEGLQQALELLADKGRLVVITFHSLEDRITKRTFADFAQKGLGKKVMGSPIVPSLDEQYENRRSRSAKMRIFEKNLCLTT